MQRANNNVEFLRCCQAVLRDCGIKNEKGKIPNITKPQVTKNIPPCPSMGERNLSKLCWKKKTICP